MPVYEFFCERCGPFEIRRSFSAASDPAFCPTCQEPAQRVFSPPLIVGSASAAGAEPAEPSLEPADRLKQLRPPRGQAPQRELYHNPTQRSPRSQH